MTTVNLQDSLKRKVAEAALEYLAPKLSKDTVLGVGSGSTTNHFIDLLEPYKNTIAGTVAASQASVQRLIHHGVSVFDLNHVTEIGFYVDGADEANPNQELIKGGGAALTREKIIASAAEEFICIVDESKCVAELGAYPLPVEIIPMSRNFVIRELAKLGGEAIYRQDVITDNHNQILDVHGLKISDAAGLEQQINHIPGVVANGLFALRAANSVMVASEEGVKHLRRD